MARVLLAEDEMLVRVVAEEDLAELGHEVTAASSGDEALAIIERGERFDLLVTDIRMSGAIDGWALARRARAALPAIRVIYVSGFAGETHDPVEHSHFLKKPYRIEQLRDAVGLA
ncbi:MAG: response regulator [Cypionkella sp.]